MSARKPELIRDPLEAVIEHHQILIVGLALRVSGSVW